MPAQWKAGDVFTVPIDPNRVGIGQIIDVLPSELFVVVYEGIWERGLPLDPQVVSGKTPLFASLTLDAKLYHDEWKIIGNVTRNLPDIKLPLSKIRISGEFFMERHDGSWARRATQEEADRLEFRKTVAPVRLENALKAHYGQLEKHPAYRELRYELIIDSRTYCKSDI